MTDYEAFIARKLEQYPPEKREAIRAAYEARCAEIFSPETKAMAAKLRDLMQAMEKGQKADG